jgi:hypothetical protein
MAKKKVEPRRREVCNFIVSGAGDVNFDKFTCTKCGKDIKWVGGHGICCGIKFGIKRK